MKRLLSLLTVFFAFVHARAEVLTTYELPEGPVPPLAREGAVWVGCYYCSAIKGRIIEQLVNAGYNVVANKSEATIQVSIVPMISIPKNGKAPEMHVDDVYGKGLDPIPPAVKTDPAEASMPVVNKGILSIDAGHVHEGMKMTGSASGGILVGIAGALLGSFIQKRAADAARTPGVVGVGVHVKKDRKKYWFHMVSAANTPETPDTLIEKAVDAAVYGLINGVQDKNAGKNR